MLPSSRARRPGHSCAYGRPLKHCAKSRCDCWELKHGLVFTACCRGKCLHTCAQEQVSGGYRSNLHVLLGADFELQQAHNRNAFCKTSVTVMFQAVPPAYRAAGHLSSAAAPGSSEAPSASQAPLQGRCTISQALQNLWFSATFTPFRIAEMQQLLHAAHRKQAGRRQLLDVWRHLQAPVLVLG